MLANDDFQGLSVDVRASLRFPAGFRIRKAITSACGSGNEGQRVNEVSELLFWEHQWCDSASLMTGYAAATALVPCVPSVEPESVRGRP